MASNTMFLTKTIYLPEKRQVVAEFSSTQKKMSKRYTFFPFFFLPNEPVFIELVKSFDPKRCKIDFLNQETIRIIAATHSDLLKIRNLIKNSLKKEVLVVPVQKQFLIEKNWGYFDCFSIEGGELVKEDTITPPNVFLDFLSNSTQKIFLDLKKSDEITAKVFLEKICLSNLLKTSILELPSKNTLLAEIFLENIFFKHKYPFISSETNQTKCNEDSVEKKELNGFAKINFLSVLHSLSTFSFFNLGFDSLNCKCCKQKSFENISPSSIVQTEFLVNGTYFESGFKKWAKNFHLTTPKKQERIDFQKEWCLESMPVGPFFAGKKEEIPFVDYKFLVKKNIVKKSLIFSKKTYFCKREESFFSKEIKECNKLALKVKNAVGKVHLAEVASNGIFFSQVLSQSFSYFYFKTFLVQQKKLLREVFFSLQDSKSRFFNQEIADSLESIQSGVMNQFREFAEKNGSKTTKIHSFNAFIKSKNPFFLAKKFSENYSLPLPEISF